MMTDEELRALPKKQANRGEVDCYYYLDAFHDKMKQVKKDMEKRAKLVPGVWRDICLIENKLDYVLKLLGATFEPEKARQLKRMGQSIHVELKYNRQAVRDNDMILVSADELATIVTAASQFCKMQMCEAQECRKCELGKVMDNLSWVSRDGRAWWEVFASLVNEQEAKNAG